MGFVFFSERRKLLGIVYLALICLLAGCAHAKSALEAEDPTMKTRILAGTQKEIFDIAYRAAVKAFPEAEISKSEGKIFILREWFWRGDTIISVSIIEHGDNQYLVDVESKGSMKRGNPTLLIEADREVRLYNEALDAEYEINKFGSKDKDDQTLSERLIELENARRKGLITKDEYNRKRKEILEGH